MRTRRFILGVAVVALVALTCGCRGEEKSTAAGCNEYSQSQRTEAMVTLQTLVQSWSAVERSHQETVSPEPAVLARALAILRCEDSARARSRRIRAISKVLAHDWSGERSGRVLDALGFGDPEAIAAFKKRVVEDVSKEVFTLYARDLAWLEYAVLRHVTLKNDTPWSNGERGAGILFPAKAWGATAPTCWRPEEPFSNQFTDPYVRLEGHVSVDKNFAETAKNIDAQQWDVCGGFWSPPSSSDPDGAQFVDKTWGSCKVPVEPLTLETTPPTPGTTYPKAHFLWERFYCPVATGDAHFENVLAAWSFPHQRMTLSGTMVPSQRMSYRLGGCGNDDVDGAIGGGIGNQPLKVVLDSGFIEVWTEGGRTHVASFKDYALSDRGATWLTHLNPALNELNDELGEMACCIP